MMRQSGSPRKAIVELRRGLQDYSGPLCRKFVLFGFAEEAGVLSGHRVDEQSPIEEQIAGLTACLSDQHAAVPARAMKGPIVRCRGRLVIAQMGSFEHTSRRSSAE